LDAAFKASKNLRVISDDKHLNDALIKQAVEAIAQAEDIYILGYGFDPQNSQRLLLNNLGMQKTDRNTRVFFTNYGDRNSINKKASQLFFDEPSKFLPPNQPIHTNTVQRNISTATTFLRVHYEKSVRDVYEALERDLEL
jgi:hypothetical protein